MTRDAYKQLLTEVRPEVIETDAQYDSVSGRFSELVRKGRGRGTEETRLIKLLGLLIQDYDRRHALPPAGMTPPEALRFLMERTSKMGPGLKSSRKARKGRQENILMRFADRNSGKTPGDLLPIFGQRSHVTEPLNATRKISAEQARKLGKLFRVNPGVFI